MSKIIKKKKNIFIILLLIIISISSVALATEDFEHEIINEETIEAINDFKDEMSTISTYLIAFAAISSVLIFIIHFVRLGASHNHPIFRAKIIREMLVSGICTALIGAIGLIFKVYVSIFM